MRLLPCCLLLLAPPLFASTPEFQWTALAQPPKIDGTVDTAEWSGAMMADGLSDEAQGTPFPETATFFLASDENYIYFAAKVGDTEPGKIVADEYRANGSVQGEDNVYFYLDLLGNLSDFSSFTFNPLGANSIRVAGGRAAKTEWLGEVQSVARRTPGGWEVEARIPWQILRLPPEGKRQIRTNFGRYLPRTQRSGTFAVTSQGRSENTPKWNGVPVPAASSDRVIQMLPYGLAGVNRDKTLLNTGVDLRTRLTDDIEAIASLNPDFRNIESSILSLDFSYFERLASDNRPFFQEGSSFFSPGGIFASQRIRSFDIGAKAVGQFNSKTSFGVLNTTTFQRENATVLSILQNPTSRSSLGMAFANLERGRIWNRALNLNYSQNFKDYYWYAQTIMTDDSDVDEAGRASIGLGRNTRNTFFSLDAGWSDRDVRARLGRFSDRDFKGLSIYTGWDQIHPKGQVSETEISGGVNKYYRLDGTPYRQGIELNTSITARNGYDFDIGGELSRFEQFDDQIMYVSLEWPRRARTRSWEVSTSWGHLSGRPYRSTSSGIRLKPERTIDVGVSLQNVEHFDNRTQLIGSFNVDLRQNRAVSGRLVASDSDWGGYLSFRRSGGKGNEYFLILGDPQSTRWRNAVAVKWVVPIDIKY